MLNPSINAQKLSALQGCLDALAALRITDLNPNEASNAVDEAYEALRIYPGINKFKRQVNKSRSFDHSAAAALRYLETFREGEGTQLMLLIIVEALNDALTEMQASELTVRYD